MPVVIPGPREGTGGGVGPPAGGGLGNILGLGFLNIPAIVVAVATQGYAMAAAASPSVSATSPSAQVISPMNLIHLRFIYIVATDS